MIDESGRLRQIDDATQHVTAIFPNDTNQICTFTAAAGANTWSNWIEIIDVPGGTKLSASFATIPGHLTALGIETLSEADTIYMVEIAWGADKVVITRGRFAGATKFETATEHLRFWAPPCPAGELLYYRMKTATAVANTCTVHFRYHLH